MNRLRRAISDLEFSSLRRFHMIQDVKRVLPHAVRISLLACFFASSVLMTACSTESSQGEITGWFQPLRSGMVQTYVNVKLDDGSTVEAVLPEEQEIWDKAMNGRNLRVEIRREGAEESWEFVRFLDD